MMDIFYAVALTICQAILCRIQYNERKGIRKLANLPMKGGSYVGGKD